MNILLTIGTGVVVIALIAYAIAIINEQKKHRINNIVLSFISIGIILDITATVFMIAGSENSAFAPHGLLGYSSLGAMLIDAILLWKYRLKNGAETIVSSRLHLYTRYAFIWWILAFITGALLAVFK